MGIVIDSSTDSEAEVARASGLEKPQESEQDVKEQAESTEGDEVGEKKQLSESEADEEEVEESEEEEDESLEEDSGESKTDKPKKSGRGYKKRVARLQKQKAEAEKQAEYWRQQALKGKDPEEVVTKEVKSEDAGKPKPDDFDDIDDYNEALVDWKVAKKLDAKIKEREQEQEAKAIKQTQEQKLSKLQKACAEYAEQNEDFEELVESVSHVKMSIAVQEVILDSEVGPELMEALAEDPDRYEKICNMGALQAAKELGKMEDKLLKSKTDENSSRESAKAETKRKKTKAPKPISPVGGGKGGDVKTPLEEADYREYRRRRDAGET